MIIDELEERLTRRYPSSYIKKVHIDKADKDYVLRYRRKDIFADLILYDVESSKPISTIEYDLHGDKCYISYFKTDYDYQGKGIGKFLYQLAQAHADKYKICCSHGIISPMGDIKGITETQQQTYETEMNFLKLMYHALGNQIQNECDLYPGMPVDAFKDIWEQNTKIAKLNNEQLQFLDSMLKYDKKLHLKIEKTK
ncbi:MAG: GNAT family N-acetyltransferase [Firmicutes bacterium]|nr:GNAT family N-acetyltransferase [Bacillota bacterium]